jgi:hypothetical protein
LAFGGVILLAQGWPYNLFLFVAVGAVVFWFEWVARREGEITFGRVWPALVLLLVVASLVAGLRGQVPGLLKGHYVFSGSQPASGEYFELGHTSDRIFLKSCLPQGPREIAVAPEEIELVEFHPYKPANPSLLDAILHHVDVSPGIKYPCP